MKKKENSQHKTFNLDNDVNILIKEGSNLSGMTQSEFVEFLVNSWDEGINPIKKLKQLKLKKKLLSEKIKEIDEIESSVITSLEKVDEWKKIKQKEKPAIIENIARVLLEGRNIDAEIIAKNQSIRLGIPSLSLLFEAMSLVKERNINNVEIKFKERRT